MRLAASQNGSGNALGCFFLQVETHNLMWLCTTGKIDCLRD